MSWQLSSWCLLLVLLIGAERLAELVVARRNERWSLSRGGLVTGQGHYPWMVVLHSGLLLGCLLEAGLAGRTFAPALGWPMLVLVVAAQGLRWWCIGALGRRWNTKVIVVPGLPPVTSGPYRFRRLRHPNYVAVAVEGAALPLVYGGWVTAAAFTVLNAVLMVVRIRCENAALSSLPPAADPVRARSAGPARA
ncbi:isoprenylcysteine carboxyl methyltransferase family protein [Actinomadura alba]|uniref:Isoprenylcysteine carboxyl methyltransferase family protein n=1 Tax=Actinomadura alba TaxID=406431 RepID=A0ABR7LTE5_9ACTN|nr:isoprenylcysteine carboxyl methyltransferase family protein [Actinomadura alba]MBC6467740.1 isoprenylcysteine carboxyl methyltransferase family protein [Actinomadura alba]